MQIWKSSFLALSTLLASCAGPSKGLVKPSDPYTPPTNAYQDQSGLRRTHANISLLAGAASGDQPSVADALEQGADINAKGNDAITPLMNAVTRSHPEIAAFMLSKGADANARDNNGTTALMRAANNGSTQLIGMLLESGADVDDQSGTGSTALHFAVQFSHYAAANVLLDHGADVNHKDDSGDAVLVKVVDNFSRRVVPTLLKKPILESEDEDFRLVKRLLALGADINAQNNKKWSPIMVAAESAPASAVDFLVKRGADLNARDDLGLRAIDWAQHANRSDAILKMLATP